MNDITTASIEGSWQMVHAELAGEAAPEMVAQRTIIELKSGTYIVRFDGEITDQGSFEVDEIPPYKTIVLRGTKGLNAGRTIPGIYQLNGQRLRICHGMDGTIPTEFSTVTSDARYMALYKRVVAIKP